MTSSVKRLVAEGRVRSASARSKLRGRGYNRSNLVGHEIQSIINSMRR
jgi:hypothetical protein